MTRTFADMTPAERDDCVGMWATYHGSTDPRPVIIWAVEDDTVWRLSPWRRPRVQSTNLDQITPRWDLLRAWTPTGEPVDGEWEEKIYQDGIGDDAQFTCQRRYVTDWELVSRPTHLQTRSALKALEELS